MSNRSGARVCLALALALAMAGSGCHKLLMHGHHRQGGEGGPSDQAAGAQASGPADTAGAKAFVDGLYARETGEGLKMFDADAGEVFDIGTRGLLKKDRQALNGQTSDVTGDWLCDCQDHRAGTPTVAIQNAAGETATAMATFPNTGRQVALDLSHAHGDWKVHDIRLPGHRRLRLALIKELKRLKGVGGGPAGHGDDSSDMANPL